MGSWKRVLLPRSPWLVRYAYRRLRTLRGDVAEAVRFVSRANDCAGALRRVRLVLACYRISYAVDCQHSEGEMLRVMDAVLRHQGHDGAVIVEAGSYKGGSTAKLSLAAALSGRPLYVFDSFEGMPLHEERPGRNIFGRDAAFPPGSYRGSVEEVTRTVSRFGHPEVCHFVKGWFHETMPAFAKPIAVAYLDVDLRSSTETCLTHLYPLLVRGGRMFSQDGHLPLILDLLKDERFWGGLGASRPPAVAGAGTTKLVEISREELRVREAIAR